MLNPAHAKKGSRLNYDVYLLTFTGHAWLGLAAGLLCSTLAFALLRNNTEVNLLYFKAYNWCATGLLSMFWTYEHSLHLQDNLGTATTTRALSMKIVTVTLSAFFILIMAAFDAHVTSFMTIESSPTRLKSFNDVLEQGYRVVAVEGSFHARLMEKSPPRTGRQLVYQELMRNKPEAYLADTKSLKEAVLADPKVAGITSSATGLQDDRILAIRDLDDAVTVYGSMVALPEGSQFLDALNYQFLKMMQTGQIQQLYRVEVLRQVGPRDSGLRDYENSGGCYPIGYENVIFPVVVLGNAAVIAILLAICEKSYLIKAHF